MQSCSLASSVSHPTPEIPYLISSFSTLALLYLTLWGSHWFRLFFSLSSLALSPWIHLHLLKLLFVREEELDKKIRQQLLYGCTCTVRYVVCAASQKITVTFWIDNGCFANHNYSGNFVGNGLSKMWQQIMKAENQFKTSLFSLSMP